jgi:hypothetical protein
MGPICLKGRGLISRTVAPYDSDYIDRILSAMKARTSGSSGIVRDRLNRSDLSGR